MKKTMLMLGTVISLLTVSCSTENYTSGSKETLSNEVVLKWNEIAYQAFGGATYQHSLMASRINAMVHLAMHDAVNAIEPNMPLMLSRGKIHGAIRSLLLPAQPIPCCCMKLRTRKDFLIPLCNKPYPLSVMVMLKQVEYNLGKEAAHAIITARAQ